jgi:hypothetical protein
LPTTNPELKQGTYVSLTYTNQKNATCREALGHGLSGDPVLCPVLATHCHVLPLHENGMSPTCPLYRYYDSTNQPHNITTHDITSELCTTLLVSGINKTAIRALGHWKSDAIFLYLHTQPSRLTSNYAHSMLSHGQYTFSPSATDYDDTDLLPHEAPDSLATMLCAVDC